MQVVTPITTVLHVLLALQQIVVTGVHTFSINSIVLQSSKIGVSASKRTTTLQQPLLATWSNGQAGMFLQETSKCTSDNLFFF
jgi:hypothetical protein